MNFKKILSNITGVSIPIFGIQWTPPILDVTIAENIITFLEDKRVLFNPTSLENANHCVQSIIGIRDEMTNNLQQLRDTKSPLGKELKKMREASRKFCDQIDTQFYNQLDNVVQTSIMERELFFLREKFGKSLASIAIAYGLSIEDDLATIIPFSNQNN